jgi:thiamine pyrophosphate-dependent acetolactate synthase large subunit-like protein
VSSSSDSPVDRRGFIKRAVAGAAALTSASAASDASGEPPGAASQAGPAPQESGSRQTEALTQDSSGSDYMLDVLKSLDLEYVCANPGSSFRGLHESLVNYGGNTRPEFITCCHEESSVAMAHGYFKVEGKPIAVFAHGTVGLQHASMAIYNAYCDRVPVYIVLGNTFDAVMRQPGFEWLHSVQDAAAMVRDYVKWDDAPQSLAHFGESAVRAYKIAMTPPYGPVVIVADTELQERPIAEGFLRRVPKLAAAAPPQGDANAVRDLARLLVSAVNPLIVADKMARTAAGLERLVELAELLQAGVVSQNGRMNFPSQHPLNQTLRSDAAAGESDLILGLEAGNLFGALNAFRDQIHRSFRPLTRSNVKVATITAGDLFLKSNYQDFQRYPEVDIAIAADAEATLPSLIDAIKPLVTADRRRAFEERRVYLASASRAALERARADAAYGWDASPISTARAAAELWARIRTEDWSLVSSSVGPSSAGWSAWPQRLWSFEKHYHHIGSTGAAGIGYGAPATVGAALANRRHGRLSVSIQNDGDLMYGPGALWTAAHHQIPLLIVMNNNRAYHEEVMQVERMAGRRSRGLERIAVGTTIDNPAIDFAKLAQSLGVHAEGPISSPADLGPAITRAVDVVKRGEPALLDVVMQPR